MQKETPGTTSRRDFLNFFGQGVLAVTALSIPVVRWMCGQEKAARPKNMLPFEPLRPSFEDNLVLAEGFQSKVLIKWGDPLNRDGAAFGYNNDYTAFLPAKSSPNEGILWVNHESVHTLFINGVDREKKRTRAQIEREQRAVGGSILYIRRPNDKAAWALVPNHPLNRRIDATTPIPLISDRPIQGSKVARGTLGNCSGGITPWGHILSCEENYDKFYNEAVYNKGERRLRDECSVYGWEQHFQAPPEHYGWVIEINPSTGTAKKLTSLGRFAHEGAAVVQAPDRRCVIYMGDDKMNEHIYKFVAAQAGSLERGTLYVADVEKGCWLALDRNTQPALRRAFRDQTEVLVRAREAAKLLGATPLPRPEDIEVDPRTGAIYACLTADEQQGRAYGSIVKIEEKGKDFRATEFTTQTYLPGGPTNGFACPDNLAFDRKGNLWMTNDISGSKLGKGIYRNFGHNGLFYIPLRGPMAGQAFQVASAPHNAELTGLSFSSDGRTLFLSVQHPGGDTRELRKPTSHWPDGAPHIPKPAVVTLQGPALDALVA